MSNTSDFRRYTVDEAVDAFGDYIQARKCEKELHVEMRPHILSDNDEEAWVRDDRAFFQAHPNRQFRIRLYDEGEALMINQFFPEVPLGWKRFTIVRQVVPGMRECIPVCLEGEPAKGEHAVYRLYVLATGFDPKSQSKEGN